MGDGAAGRAFLGSARDVHVNPLMVFGAMGELVDAGLADLDPRRYAQFLIDQLGQFGRAHGCSAHVSLRLRCLYGRVVPRVQG